MRRRTTLTALALAPLAACATGGSRPPEQPIRVVFFTDDSVALGEAALAVVADAARDAAAVPGLPVRVLGFVAPDPGQAPTVALARARAERVANELVRLGVARDRIQVQGRGPVPYDAVPVESRRVEIRLGSV